MKKLTLFLTMALLLSAVLFVGAAQAAPDDQACWGQASAVFAQMGEMGEHSSQQPTPRLGLGNLASALFDAGVIAEDSIQVLGQFVAETLGLTVEACM